jgi:crotonobetainyl-CoA:carnitine CoA-transferase CaiB-like acyl-CoA transferase
MTGQGQRVETSLLQSITSFVGGTAARYLMTGKKPAMEGERNNLASAFVAQDGKPLVFHLSSPPKFWEGLTEAIGKPELREDPRFVRRQDRVKNYNALHEICQSVFATAPRDYWVEQLRKHDVPAGPLYDIGEVFDDPQIQHLGMAVEVEHPQMGTVRLSANAVKLKGTAIRYDIAPPTLGEHTDEILTGLGYDTERIKELGESGVV